MNKNIGILGGDLRIKYLAELFAKENYTVYLYGMEKVKFIDRTNIKTCMTLEELFNCCENIISGIPFAKDKNLVNTPFSDKKIYIRDILKNMHKKTLVAGAIRKEIIEEAQVNKTNIIDLMENEAFTILNVIPTVEGAIQTAMENTNITIHNSNCLVLGHGRIGKLLSKHLKNLGANVSSMARKDRDLALIKAEGNKGIYINDLDNNLDNLDIIFNTIPSLILDNKKLRILMEKSKNVLIIEIASEPGGIDLNTAKEYEIKVIKAMGLPGKVAPKTAAKYIKETIDKIL